MAGRVLLRQNQSVCMALYGLEGLKEGVKKLGNGGINPRQNEHIYLNTNQLHI